MAAAPLLLLSPRTSCRCVPAYLWWERLSKRSSLHFKSPQLPLPVSQTPTHARTCAQLSAVQILFIPWPFLPPLPALTPPQLRAVEIIIFYACHSSPHTDKDYKRWTKRSCLHVFLAPCSYLYADCFCVLSYDTLTCKHCNAGTQTHTIRYQYIWNFFLKLWERPEEFRSATCIMISRESYAFCLPTWVFVRTGEDSVQWICICLKWHY